MKRTSMYTAVLALSLAMALAGGGLACRTFRERLDALEEQAVLQHQRNVCGLEDAFAAEYDTRSGAGYLSSGADSVCARVGQAYTRGQWLILGSSTAAFALMREGDVAYSALPESVAAADVQQAAAATDGILLRGETLLLGGVLNTPYSYPVAVVTAADASEAFAARNRLLYSWLAVQAIITLAALVAAYHYERLQELNARQSRFVADLTHELKTPLTSLIGYADLLRGGTLDAERRRTAAEALYHESARLESLSQQLLALNGLQEDGVVLRPVRVAAAFADAVRSLPDVVLDCDAPAEAVVLADRVLLADLVRNLALNAWHAGPVQPENGSVQVQCYGCSYTGNIQTVSFQMYTVNAYKVTESGEMYSIDDETSIGLMYLPGNGAFLQVSVLDNRLPAAESTPEEQVQAFLTQLDTTLDGSWEQTTTENGLEYKHTSGVLRVVRYAPDEVDFALCVTLNPDVYGGLDTLSNVVIGPDGTIYTPGGEYGTF